MSNVETPEGVQPDAVPLSGIRRSIARQMERAWNAPVFHLTVAVDMTRALALSNTVAAASVTDVLVRAYARSLRAFPALNAHYGEGAVTTFDDANVGLAVATDAGLTVPVIFSPADASLVEIADQRRERVAAARSGSLRPQDVFGATSTLSNLGMYGVETFDAILNVPQVAILAAAATRPEIRLVEGEIAAVPTCRLTLTSDHRAVDGAQAAEFLRDLVVRLEGDK
jgi:pyruvate dehydrogenase E2 component (dihydrolipoamide acetyltransferase)